MLLARVQEMDSDLLAAGAGDRDAVLSEIEDPEIRSLVDFNYGPWDRRRENATACSGRRAEARRVPASIRRHGRGRIRCGVRGVSRTSRGAPEPAFRRSPRRRGQAGRRRLSRSVRKHVGAGLVVRSARPPRWPTTPRSGRTSSGGRKPCSTDDYRASEPAWLDTKDAGIDLIIGPVEEYEDALLGRKTAHEGILLLKDKDRSARFDRVTALLPQLQAGLPVPIGYKMDVPSLDGGIGVYDVIAYAGDASAMPRMRSRSRTTRTSSSRREPGGSSCETRCEWTSI